MAFIRAFLRLPPRKALSWAAQVLALLPCEVGDVVADRDAVGPVAGGAYGLGGGLARRSVGGLGGRGQKRGNQA